MTKRRKKQIITALVYGFAVIGVISTLSFFVRGTKNFIESMDKEKIVTEAPEIDEQLLTVNDYSRPGIALDNIKGIVVHYTANPGTTAQQNHDYFEGLATTGETKVSSHYIIGLDGEIIQCVPDDEIAYASNDRNSDTLSIECCHFDETGEFYVNTYNSLVHLCAYLMGKYSIPIDGVIRHYDVTGKECPKYFVDNPEAWLQFKTDVTDYIDKYGTKDY